ncbi:MAG: sulfite exporter TauE/SafE family protein [Roseobacter sp.]
MEYAVLVAGLAVASAFAGILAGFLGVGGGIVLVPAMFWMFELIDFSPELSMHMAVATSLATIIFTAISSSRAHHKRGNVDASLVKRWAIPMAVGALSGGLVARYFDGDMLKLVFGTIGVLVALNFCRPRSLVLGEQLPASPFGTASISASIGLISSLMGIGGGTLGVPTLTAFSVPMKRAVGTAAAFGLIIAVPAVVGFVVSGWGVAGRPPLSLGYVSLPAACAIIPITTVLAPVGAEMAHRLPGQWIKYGFAVFLGITSLRMLSSAFF